MSLSTKDAFASRRVRGYSGDGVVSNLVYQRFSQDLFHSDECKGKKSKKYLCRIVLVGKRHAA